MRSLPRLARPALAAAIALGAALAVPVVTAGPAAAEVTGTTSTSDVVLYDHCQQHPIHYDLQVGPLTSPYRVEYQVADPDGFLSEGTVINSATNPPLSGTFNFVFCGAEEPGTYTVIGTLRYTPLTLSDVTLSRTTFQVRRMASRTALRSEPLGHGRYRLTTTVRQQAERGYERADGASVVLQRRVGGHWRRVEGLTLTTRRGTAVARVAGRPGQRYRAVLRTSGNLAGSTSRPVTLRHR